jgi:hypothetical protein
MLLSGFNKLPLASITPEAYAPNEVYGAETDCAKFDMEKEGI